MEIDVVMLTKNSNKPWFRRVLNAIARNIPVHCFILIDGYSTDGTIETVKQVFRNRVKILRTHAGLGAARYIGMKLVDTEWFAFIDSDVEILDGWFKAAEKYMWNSRIYGIQGIFVSPHNLNSETSDFIEIVKSLREIDAKLMMRYGFYTFLGADTGHVLLRSGVIKLLDPRIMTRLKNAEDFYMAQSIVKSGFYYIRNAAMKAVHWSTGMITKTLARSFGENGLFIEIPYHIYMAYALARLFSNLTKRNLDGFLAHSIQLIGSTISYIRTQRLKQHDLFRTSVIDV